ncbi:hypothetical protein JCM8547_006000 [Rhodosporidiobolus lusitaniae]
MSGPFATPTVRASNPLDDALALEATFRVAPPFTASSPPLPSRSTYFSPSRQPRSPPSKPSFHSHASGSSYAHDRARSPPAKRAVGGAAGGKSGGAGAAPHPQAGRDPARPHLPAFPLSAGRRHPQAHAQHGAPQPPPEDLEQFAALCRRLYYDKDPQAAKQVDALLAKLPPSFRTPYARTMAAVRAAFHRDEEIRRRQVVEATLASTSPGASVKKALQISPESTSVAAMRSSRARQIRREGLKAFLDANCVKAMPGTHPFFKSLFATLWLQGLDSSKGGAGERCVEWEVDVAVFSEAGGGAGWGNEAIETLKGVLGMSEIVRIPSQTDSSRTSFFESTIASSRASSIAEPSADAASSAQPPHPQPNEHGVLEARPSVASGSTVKKPAPPVPPHRGSVRDRSKSDPFLAPEEKAAKLALAAAASSSSPHPNPPLSPVSPAPPSPDPTADATTPFLAYPSAAPSPSLPPRPTPTRSPSSHLLPAPLKPQFRTFTLPSYLTNPECRALCRLFPDFISSPTRPKARFRSNSASKAEKAKKRKAVAEGAAGGDLEAQEGKEEEQEGGGVGKVGHGELRIGKSTRDKGWKGTAWERFCGWFKGLFGR